MFLIKIHVLATLDSLVLNWNHPVIYVPQEINLRALKWTSFYLIITRVAFLSGCGTGYRANFRKQLKQFKLNTG